jgi:hypothetical protein
MAAFATVFTREVMPAASYREVLSSQRNRNRFGLKEVDL